MDISQFREGWVILSSANAKTNGGKDALVHAYNPSAPARRGDSEVREIQATPGKLETLSQETEENQIKVTAQGNVVFLRVLACFL